MLKNPILTMLSATNPTHFRDRIKEKDVSGGFVARNLIVYENKRSKKNALLDGGKPLDLLSIADDLRTISKAEGEFHLTASAKKFFVDWYMDFEPESMGDRTGVLNRLNDHILKVAMLMSLSRDLNLVIDLDDVTRAHEQCMVCVSNVQRAIAGVGLAPSSASMAIVLEELLSNDEMSRAKLLVSHYGDFFADELDRIVETMTQADALLVEQRGGQVYYKLKPKIKDYYKRKKSLKGGKTTHAGQPG